MPSLFDPNQFGSMTFTESNDTESIPVPTGDHAATCDSYKIDKWQSRDGTSAGLKLILMWRIESDAVKQLTGRPINKVKQELMLDLTEEGTLDFGKGMNTALGRTRKATGLNDPGAPFAFPMFVGRQATVSVKHRDFEGRPIAEVKDVAMP